MINLLLLFVAGHLVVVAIVRFFFHMLRREPELAARRDAVFELNHRPARIEAGEAEIAASKSELKHLDRRIDDIQAVIVDDVPLDDPPATKWAFLTLAVILTELEACVFFLLTAPSALLGFSAEMWAFLAAPIAVGWVVVLHVLTGAVVADKHRPTRTVRRAKRGAVLFGIGVIISVWMVLSGRNLSEANLIEELTGMGLMALAGLLAVCSAFCSIIATTLAEAQRNEHELERLAVRHERYLRHLELVERDLARLKAVGESGPTAGSAVPPFVTTAVLLLALLLGATATSAAQNLTAPMSPTTITEAQGASVTTFARTGACEIIIDVTSSNQRAALVATVVQVAAHLPAIIDALNCQLLRIVPFGGELFVQIDEIALPTVPDPATLCRDAKPEPLTARAKAVEMFYPTLKAEHQQRAVDACITERRAANEALVTARATALAKASAALEAVADLPARGPCTALYQAVQRSFRRAQHQVIVSDSIHTCATPTTALRVPADGHVVFLLIPSTNAETAPLNALVTALDALERAFPTATVLLAPEATPAFWKHFRSEPRGDKRPTELTSTIFTVPSSSGPGSPTVPRGPGPDAPATVSRLAGPVRP
jgi:hypothetical protein